jgi:arylsulfatase
MGPNVAVVVLDTLRYDSFREEFDFLRGIEFQRCFAPSHWTIPSHAGLFVGRSPLAVQVHAKSPALDCEAPTIAERLAAAGYRTRMWTANSQLHINPGWSRGFDEIRGPQNLDPAADHLFNWSGALADIDATGLRKYLEAGMKCLRSDAATLPSVLDMTRRKLSSDRRENDSPKVRRRLAETPMADEDEFLFVNLMETHTPYWPGPDAGFDDPVDVVVSQSFVPETIDEAHVIDAYRRTAQYLAEQYEHLFASLTERFDYVFTVADHGELLGESGWWNHGYGLFEELLHVPCHVWYDGVDDATVDRPVSLLDVPATVAEITGVPRTGDGYDLLGSDAPSDRAIVTEYHGVLPWLLEQTDRFGVDRERFESRDSPLFGLADAAGYRFERHEGDGGFTAADRERIATEFDVRDVDLRHGSTTVSEEAMGRLEELGYA